QEQWQRGYHVLRDQVVDANRFEQQRSEQGSASDAERERDTTSLRIAQSSHRVCDRDRDQQRDHRQLPVSSRSNLAGYELLGYLLDAALKGHVLDPVGPVISL